MNETHIPVEILIVTKQDTAVPQSPGGQRTLLFAPWGWGCNEHCPTLIVKKTHPLSLTLD